MSLAGIIVALLWLECLYAKADATFSIGRPCNSERAQLHKVTPYTHMNF